MDLVFQPPLPIDYEVPDFTPIGSAYLSTIKTEIDQAYDQRDREFIHQLGIAIANRILEIIRNEREKETADDHV